MDILCINLFLLLLIHLVSANCFGSIEGLDKFSTEVNDAVLFFDTATNWPRQSSPWDLTSYCDIPSMLNLTSNSDVDMKRTSEGSGMHRKVTTVVKLPQHLLSFTSNCYAMFAELVTNSFSLDIYEIERNSNYQVYYNASIDIEKPSYQSDNTTILIFIPLVLKNNHYEAFFTLNWHLRYHNPSWTHSYVNVTLLSPSVYFFCYGNQSIDKVCNLKTLNSKAALAPCPNTAEKTLCSWFNKQDIGRDIELRFAWPVGIYSQQPYITFFTLIITWISTLCIVYKVFKLSVST